MGDEKRYSYEFAMGEYEKLKKYLKDKGYESEPSGSLRRKREDVGDIDFLVKGDRKEILGIVEEYREIEKRINKYEFQLKSGVCIHTIPEVEAKYSFTLWQSTGPKKHVKWMKRRYSEEGKTIDMIGADERKIYEDIGLSYIEPKERFKYLGEDR